MSYSTIFLEFSSRDRYNRLDTSVFLLFCSSQGGTSVYWAAREGHTETVRLLAQDFHADVNIPRSTVC